MLNLQTMDYKKNNLHLFSFTKFKKYAHTKEATRPHLQNSLGGGLVKLVEPESDHSL